MKAIRIFLLILIIIGIALIFTRNIWVPKLVDKIIGNDFKQGDIVNPTLVPISITDKKITEENFNGKTSVIHGTGLLAVKMQEYINATISDFRKQSNTDVPDIRKNFGEDVPSSAYEIDVNSKYIKGPKTESIVTSVYTFTGGAHGSTIYKVITANRANGKILSLSDIVQNGKQDEFTKLLKKKLSEWIPEGSDTPVVFTDSVSGLTFDSFSNWAIDKDNLIIYFNQYELGPSALGAVEFPLQLKDIQDLLN